MDDLLGSSFDALTDWVSETDFKVSAKLVHGNVSDNSTGGLELRPVMTEMSYFEDLFGNVTSGYIALSDSSNFQHEMTMFGDEYVKLKLDRPRDNPPSEPLKRYQRIYSIEGRNLSKDSNENYMIKFASEEMTISEQYRISKAYKDVTIAEIVKDIALTYLKIPAKDFNYVPTLGTYHIIVPNLKPFEAINWLSTLAICEDTRIKGATYTFFQNRNGWYFSPVLGMYGDFERYNGSCNTETNPYVYKVKNNQSEEEKFGPKTDPNKNILSYQIIESFDMNSYTMDGMYANRLHWNDNHKRLHEITDFDYEKYFEDLKTNLPLYRDYQPYSLLSNAQDRFNNQHNQVPDAIVKMGFRTENNKVEHTIPHRYSQLRQFFAIRIRIVLLGDSSLAVGKVVYVDIKAPAPVDGGSNDESRKKMDKLYSGYYLILALRHRIDQESGFETILELGKDSFLSAVDSMDNPGLANYNNSSFLQEAKTLGYF